ncbi:type II toxin-antitoxin system HipA family toxin [Achromobacter sp. JUb104]|uniref:type II toxin-antitoxin system HipA family toxin n=1 Tax=Achromobacter sp. JUb104 TaxID=2940590 RepID=UPI002167FA97|nr:type II toxin-antitoxin system HipA family toxin [Achromobacter sp. JUb104]MCS3507494.1 serine/threonine-protein kinase HipA [Achromobacter sp. JUb104]
MKLDIYVQNRMVGVLEQTGLTSYVFTYLPDVPRELAVSLLMPPRTASWNSPFLFPVFQVSLPEGALRQILERTFAKNFDKFGDMELLAIVGETLIGQVRAVPHGQQPSKRSMHEALESLLSADLKSIVQHYLGEDSRGPGVSGGFLKFLARSPVEGDGVKRTLAIDQWLVKLNDPDRDDIVLLEHFGMMAAREMGLDVPETHLARDASRILVHRFDQGRDGVARGVEDMCALTGQPARDKFSGSVERIVKTILAFCPGAAGQGSAELFYAQYLLAATIRNGDAHLKNFGLLYEPGQSPRLSPVYDMLTMAAYAPRDNFGDANDGMALTLGGTKSWPTADALKLLGKVCDISTPRQKQWQGRMGQALIKTAGAVEQFQADNPDVAFAHAARMVELWAHGMRQVDAVIADELMERAHQLEGQAAGPA